MVEIVNELDDFSVNVGPNFPKELKTYILIVLSMPINVGFFLSC